MTLLEPALEAGWTPIDDGGAERVLQALVVGADAGVRAGFEADAAHVLENSAVRGDAGNRAMRRGGVNTAVLMGAVVAGLAFGELESRRIDAQQRGQAALLSGIFRPPVEPAWLPGQADHSIQGVSMRVMNVIASSFAGLLVLQNAAAQSTAIEWTTASGGNGHWYLGVVADGCTWTGARAAALAMGGDLVSLGTQAESDWVYAQIASQPTMWRNRIGPRIGLIQDPSGAEPAGGWRWSDGTPLTYTKWNVDGFMGQANPVEGGPCIDSDYGGYYGWPNMPMNSWGSYQDSYVSSCHWETFRSYVVEWSADCNGDGIVDFGQIRAGQLEDINGNNKPDCCEQGIPCVALAPPYQWTTASGGNGHWYQFVPVPTSWHQAMASARARGGDLASLTTAAERTMWMALIPASPILVPGCPGCTWIGAYQLPGAAEPAGGWAWSDGSQWSYTFWNPGEPSNTGGIENYGYGSGPTNGRWNDSSGLCCAPYVIEWSADCNGDGIVDFGQILAGQLVDANADGIPDTCQSCVGDLLIDHKVDGADLAIVLSQWGLAMPSTISDINHDGTVDGNDLGILLAHWGPCAP